MGLGRLNPGCGCSCVSNGCPPGVTVPVFSGWTVIDGGVTPGFDRNVLIGSVTWSGSVTASIEFFFNGVLFYTDPSASSPVVLSLAAGSTGSTDGTYEFVINNGCTEPARVVCTICSYVGVLAANPPPEPAGDYNVAWPGRPDINLCSWSPTWVPITNGLSNYGFTRLNPYSCVDSVPIDNGPSIWANP